VKRGRAPGAWLPTGTSLLENRAISTTTFRHNHQIRISPIRLINDKEEQIGIVSTSDALRMAQDAGMDLVEVAPTARPPVCKIMDYGKFRYMQQKKEDKSRASNKGGQLKEMKIKTVKIGDHDLLIKVNHARDFLKEGNKVQFTLQFRGREMAHLELGRAIFKKVKDELFLVSKVERDAKMEGRRMTMVLQPDHKNPDAPRPVERVAPVVTGSRLNIPIRPPITPGAVGPAARVAGATPGPGATPGAPRPLPPGAVPTGAPQTAGANR
jgi:translation initiation factor IF-3